MTASAPPGGRRPNALSSSKPGNPLMPEAQGFDRRDFLKARAAGAAAVAFGAASYDRVYGANEHRRRLRRRRRPLPAPPRHHQEPRQADKNGVVPVAVCDVWDGVKKARQGEGRQGTPTCKGSTPRPKLVGLDPRRQEARHQGLSTPAGAERGRRGLHRHAGPLARQDHHRRAARPASTSTAKSR